MIMNKVILTLIASVAVATAYAQNPLNGSDPGIQMLPTTGENGSDPGLQQTPRMMPGGVGPVIGGSSSSGWYNPSVGYHYHYHRPVSEADFRQLLAAINSQAFPSTQLPMVKAAGLCGWFTCSQCAAIMRIFSFDNNRLQVVRYLAPHLVNPYDCYPIINQLTFESSRQSAWNIIAQFHR